MISNVLISFFFFFFFFFLNDFSLEQQVLIGWLIGTLLSLVHGYIKSALKSLPFFVKK